MHRYHDRSRTVELALKRSTPAVWPLLLAIALLAAAISLAWQPRGASAAPDVTPVLIDVNGNLTCSELEGEGQSWTELKVDPNQNGLYSDGALTVTITSTTNDKTFNWSSNIGVDAVFVKAGSAGHYLYLYDPPSESTGDDGLTTPGAGSTNQISHISFCYDAGGSTPTAPPPTPTPPPATPTAVPATPTLAPAAQTPAATPTPSPAALGAVALPNTGDAPGSGGGVALGLAGLVLMAVAALAYASGVRSRKPPQA